MKKTVIAISVILVFLVAVSQAMAWHPMGRSFGYAENLNLTAEQSRNLNAHQQDFLKEALPIRNELAIKALEFRTLLAQSSTDKSKVKAKQQEIFALQKKLQEKSLAYELDARDILTPEQISMLPPGCGLGFMASAGGMGYGKGCGRGMGNGGGYGRGMGYHAGPCPYGLR